MKFCLYIPVGNIIHSEVQSPEAGVNWVTLKLLYLSRQVYPDNVPWFSEDVAQRF